MVLLGSHTKSARLVVLSLCTSLHRHHKSMYDFFLLPFKIGRFEPFFDQKMSINGFQFRSGTGPSPESTSAVKNSFLGRYKEVSVTFSKALLTRCVSSRSRSGRWSRTLSSLHEPETILPSSDNRMRTFSSVALSNQRNVADIWNKWFEREASWAALSINSIHLRDRLSPLNVLFSVVSS